MITLPYYSIQAAVKKAEIDGIAVDFSEVTIEHVTADSDMVMDCFFFKDEADSAIAAYAFMDSALICALKGSFSDDEVEDKDFSILAMDYLKSTGKIDKIPFLLPIDIYSIDSFDVYFEEEMASFETELTSLFFNAFSDIMKGRFFVIPDGILENVNKGEAYKGTTVGFLGISPAGYDDSPVIVLG